MTSSLTSELNCLLLLNYKLTTLNCNINDTRFLGVLPGGLSLYGVCSKSSNSDNTVKGEAL
jgi:hypothetical protein